MSIYDIKVLLNMYKSINNIRREINKHIKRQDIIAFINDCLNEINYSNINVSKNTISLKTENKEVNFKFEICFLPNLENVEEIHICKSNDNKQFETYIIKFLGEVTTIEEKEYKYYIRKQIFSEYDKDTLVYQNAYFKNMGIFEDISEKRYECYFNKENTHLMRRTEETDHFIKSPPIKTIKYDSLLLFGDINIDTLKNKNQINNLYNLSNLIETDEKIYNEFVSCLKETKLLKLTKNQKKYF